MQRSLIFIFILQAFITRAQLTIGSSSTVVANSGTTISTTTGINNSSPSVDLSKVSLLLAGTGILSTKAPLDLLDLEINGSGDYTIVGDWSVGSKLTFTKGQLITGGGRLLYSGSNELISNGNSYVNGPLFIKGKGSLTFPIGTATNYFPAQLTGVADADVNTELGLEIITSNPGFIPSGSIKEIFPDHFWELTISNGTFSGSTISLSNNLTGNFFNGIGSPSILEKNQTGKDTDLGASINNPYYSSTLKNSSTGKYYALAKSDIVNVTVHKLITPNDDGKNDVLVIEGIDNFKDNEVSILDRWGVPFKKWAPFTKYADDALSQQLDADFSKLAIGNYIVVVTYSEKGATKTIKQMISVLK